MPLKSDHLNKARHDETFVSSLDIDSTSFIDWAITAMFYAALHYVEAYFATQGKHSPDHRIRDSSIRRDLNIRKIFNDYNELKNFSINARYYMYPFKPSDVTANLQPRLESLKTHVKHLL